MAGFEPAVSYLLGRRIPCFLHSNFGALGETRTRRYWFLRPARLPIAARAHYFVVSATGLEPRHQPNNVIFYDNLHTTKCIY